MKTESFKAAAVATLEIHGEEFVLLPRVEYDRLRGIPADAVDAVAFGMESLGGSLRLAREEAGLTQAELAKRLRRSQSMVSSAETGTVRIGQRYVAAVLRACKLPEDWRPGPGVSSG
jgi:DNA-binding XRE family transcriptional regulator